MKVSIFTLTNKGIELGVKLLDIYSDANLYTLEKFNSTIASPYKDGFKETIKSEFDNSDVLIFICATGIVVRFIADLLKSKKTDPAVIVMDDNANNVISLLSGHIGGANEETIKIAKLLNSNPVITTASDVNNKPSVDMIAKHNNLKLVDFLGAKDVTASIVNNEKVLVLDDYYKGQIIKGLGDLKVKSYSSDINYDDYDGFIVISNKNKVDYPTKKHCVFLYPKNIVIGIGCRRGVSKEHILAMIEDALYDLNLSIHSIKHIATVDIKADEEGLISACCDLNLPLVIVSRKDILQIEDKYIGSDFVKNTIGVRAVSEPCAELTSADGKFLLEKLKVNGATISIWEEKV